MDAESPLRPIDLHFHGAGDFDTQTDLSEDILSITQIQAAEGVAETLLSIYPAPIPTMRRHMAAVKEAIEKQRSAMGYQQSGGRFLNAPYQGPNALPFARIIGIHLEGPFLNPSQCGALDSRSFLSPTEYAYRELAEGFEDTIRTITVAPELAGAPELIREIVRSGVVVNMGHSNASYLEAEAGFRAGARGITHIFNAMRLFTHREPGIAGFGLTNPDIYVEVIADPYHLHLETIRLLFRAKSARRILIVSDSVKGGISIGTPSKAGRGGEAGEPGRPAACAATPSGRLRGGSMSIVAASKRLMANGFDGATIRQAITENQDHFLG